MIPVFDLCVRMWLFNVFSYVCSMTSVLHDLFSNVLHVFYDFIVFYSIAVRVRRFLVLTVFVRLRYSKIPAWF